MTWLKFFPYDAVRSMHACMYVYDHLSLSINYHFPTWDHKEEDNVYTPSPGKGDIASS